MSRITVTSYTVKYDHPSGRRYTFYRSGGLRCWLRMVQYAGVFRTLVALWKLRSAT